MRLVIALPLEALQALRAIYSPSLEGLDMLVPMLDEIIVQAARSNFHFIFPGMAHRGRLNPGIRSSF